MMALKHDWRHASPISMYSEEISRLQLSQKHGCRTAKTMDQANVLIVGGGVVGCAIAAALSRRWQDVFLVEKNPKFGMATSSRNSGVIHSGIYYPTNSLKARLCVEGNQLTKEFCAKHNVPHRTTGKLVVAKAKEEEPVLLALKKKGED